MGNKADMKDYEKRAHVAMFLVLFAFQVANTAEAGAPNPEFWLFRPLFISVVAIVYLLVLLHSVLNHWNQSLRETLLNR